MRVLKLSKWINAKSFSLSGAFLAVAGPYKVLTRFSAIQLKSVLKILCYRNDDSQDVYVLWNQISRISMTILPIIIIPNI